MRVEAENDAIAIVAFLMVVAIVGLGTPSLGLTCVNCSLIRTSSVEYSS